MTTDPQVIEAWAAAALDPTRGRITCIGVANDDINHVFAHQSELVLLQEFWAFVDSYKFPPTFITYSGEQFDLPFLRLRSLAHGLTPHWMPSIGFQHVDLFKIIFGYYTKSESGPNRPRRNKDAVCEALGIEQHEGNGLTGADMPHLWAEGNTERIVEHCRDDIKRQWLLYKRLHEARLV